jgi:putative MFS transporter
LVWYAAATVVMGLQHSVSAICLWRFVAAVGIGAEVVAIDSLLSELVPKRLRGRGFALSKGLQYLAVPVVGLMSVFLVPHGVLGVPGWRVLAFLPVVGAAAIWLVQRGLPESPRWLVEHGRADEAARIVAQLETDAEARSGVPFGPLEIPPAPELGASTFRALWARDVRWRVVMISLASSAGTIAYFGFGSWLPSLLQAQGFTVTKSLAYTAATALAQPLAPFIFLFFADRLERKWQIIIGATLSAIFGLVFTHQSTALGFIGCGVAISAANNLLSAAMHTYRGELFPTRVRGRAIGFVYAIDRLVAAFNSYAVGYVLLVLHVPGVFAFLTGALVVCALTVGLGGPRTTGRSVEEIAGTEPPDSHPAQPATAVSR